MTDRTHTRARSSRAVLLLAATALTATAASITGCTPGGEATGRESGTTGASAADARQPGTVLMVRDTSMSLTYDAAGIAEPMQQVTLSTKLVGTVTAVLVAEGDRVQRDQPVVRIDARDLTAKSNQVAASIADAEAMQAEAAAHATRFRALYADSAATRVQYEAAMTGLARADAGVRAARAAASEVEAISSYATVRAPFNGTVTARMANPGTFAAPGAPLVSVQDASRLRITAAVAGDVVRALRRGQSIPAMIDGVPATATIEAVLPTASANLFTINALVDNRGAQYRAGSAATLRIPTGTQRALLIPREALVHDGDLTGVVVRGSTRDERRWIRTGSSSATHVEVTSGLAAGESILMPATATKPGA